MRTDNDTSDERLLEHVANSNVRNADIVPITDLLQREQQLLEERPSAPGIDHL